MAVGYVASLLPDVLFALWCWEADKFKHCRRQAEQSWGTNLWLSSQALQPLWDLLWSAQPWDLPTLLRREDGATGCRLPRKIILEIPQWQLAPVFHLECFSYGLSSWVLVCPADPWVLSSHIPVLASCCSLANPPLKVPDALGPHTCLAPLGTCSPCPTPALLLSWFCRPGIPAMLFPFIGPKYFIFSSASR